MTRWLRRSALLMACLAGTAGPMPARADATSGDGAAAKLAKLHGTVMNPEARFSARATLAEIDAVEAPEGSREHGRADHLRAVIEMKVDRGADAIRHGENALRIDAAATFLTPHERLNLAYGVARQQEAARDCPGAIPNFRIAVALAATDRDTGDDQRLGIRERLGYCLHEAKLFAEALSLNQEVLAGGTRLFGDESPKLVTVLTNLAQNHYELGDKAAARPMLERALRIALADADGAKAEDLLFQLGVLAFETGRRSEALAFMNRRLASARAAGDETRIAAAEADLAELHRRLRS